jgi:hypothetical protein
VVRRAVLVDLVFALRIAFRELNFRFVTMTLKLRNPQIEESAKVVSSGVVSTIVIAAEDRKQNPL